MLTLDFSEKFLSLDGVELNDMAPIVGEAIAGQRSSTNSIKLFDLAVRIFKEGKIEVDQADFDLLKGIFDKDESLTVMAKGQILKRFISSPKA